MALNEYARAKAIMETAKDYLKMVVLASNIEKITTELDKTKITLSTKAGYIRETFKKETCFSYLDDAGVDPDVIEGARVAATSKIEVEPTIEIRIK